MTKKSIREATLIRPWYTVDDMAVRRAELFWVIRLCGIGKEIEIFSIIIDNPISESHNTWKLLEDGVKRGVNELYDGFKQGKLTTPSLGGDKTVVLNTKKATLETLIPVPFEDIVFNYEMFKLQPK